MRRLVALKHGHAASPPWLSVLTVALLFVQIAVLGVADSAGSGSVSSVATIM
jgi:hypothetical protein